MLTHLFLHMHKVGGTSVVENLWKPAVPLAERHVEEDLIHGGERFGEFYSYLHMHILTHQYGLAYRDVFASFWNAGKVPRGRRLYSGHFGYGIHDVVGGPCRYSTVVRDPVARTVSHFHLSKSLGNFAGDFAEYLDSGRVETRNYQVTALTRNGFSQPGGVAEGDLHEAVHNLSTEFDFCVTEHIDAFVDGMIAKYRLPVENRRRVANRTADSTHVKGWPLSEHRRFPVDEVLLPRLAELNQLDLRLYEFAQAASAARWLAG